MDAPFGGSLEYCPEPVVNWKERMRWRWYRLLPSQWKQLVERQGGVCAMCFENEPTDIDHYHAHGTDSQKPQDITLIRGAVCHRCNLVLGVYENPNCSLKQTHLIWLAETYLEKERPFANG